MDHEFIVRVRLAHDPEFLAACILKLYKQQLVEEQDMKLTCVDNGVGFNKSDSGILSDYAEHLLEGHVLPAQHIKDAAARMKKYSKQLLTLLSADEIE